MSKATLELISKLYAKLSDAYETLASEADDEAPAAKGKAKAEVDDDDLPAPKKAGTAGKAKAPAGKKAPAKVEEPADEEVTEADLVAAATALIKATDRATAVKIIKKHGGEKIADLDEDVYPKVLAAFQKAMPADDDTGSEDDDI
jgi:hypothetical protein